ncbi:hypothetical protein DV096_18565 [Bradymonadaceae bacterium TMQ3]|uniref:EF-hand domain-containing protein n=1 Tax=Lujinxingia sediminis TaxID=2480984 RepID=A0ABY0CN87_9DELT|nr:hypothetical protein [Lujinxingia sediminis]RDV36458.1 hypothetical protein DV096_18565 [Bradymonadaceae bacterium TMQ3]RVU41430.1 hypothetical protein EA187_18985 [Lujinxingia sediminis]TXC74511.1 hypothetical protein FRC91_15465 [Bradymonadales bacterium TMQ1]
MFSPTTRTTALASLLLLPLAGACGESDAQSPDGQGMLNIFVYGEDFVEEGIPADAMSDGWAIAFDRFQVEVTSVTVGAANFSDVTTIEIAPPTGGEGHQLGELSVDAGTYESVDYALGTIRVGGSAEKEGVTKTFDWTFEVPTTYGECHTTVTVAADQASRLELTIHADHLFYDSLVSEDPALVFDPLAAADTNEDGNISKEELEAALVGTLDVGNEEIADLWSWLEAQVATLGHIDGEGHCH